jgi:hypothetical protein
MQLYPTGTEPPRGAEIFCRQTQWNLLVLLAILWAIPVGMWNLSVPSWVMVIGSAPPVLMSWPMLSTWWKRGRADNWVLVVHPKGVWLNLRNVDYCEAAAGDTVVQLPFHEIIAARQVIHHFMVPGGKGSSTEHRHVYLDLRLGPEHVRALGQAIATERSRPLPEKKHFGGILTSRTKMTHALIEVEGDDTLRIKYSAANVSLSPNVKRVLAALDRFVEVVEHGKKFDGDWREMEGEVLETFVRGLVASGQSMDAIKLLKRNMNLSTTEAKKLVDDMKIVKSV